MLLQAVVLSADVQQGQNYDSRTGVRQDYYSVNMAVIDAVTDEKWDVQLLDGFPELDELRDLKRENASNEQLAEVANRLREQLPQKFTQLDLEVLRLKGKQAPYLKLVCRLAQAAEVVAA